MYPADGSVKSAQAGIQCIDPILKTIGRLKIICGKNRIRMLVQLLLTGAPSRQIAVIEIRRKLYLRCI